MLHIKSLSADENLKKAAEASGDIRAHVHSRFDRTLNLMYKDQLITVAVSEVDNAPFTIRVAKRDFEKIISLSEQPITVTHSGIQLGDQVLIDWTAGDSWRRALPEFPLSVQLLYANLRMSEQYLRERHKPSWMYSELAAAEPPTNRFEQLLDERLRQESAVLVRLLQEYPISTGQLQETKLIGLGRGLTPSGDDILTGISFIAAMPGFPVALLEVTAGWCDVAKSKTNVISAAMMQHASKGKGRDRMYDLVEQWLCSQDPDVVVKALEKVLAIGSSSGSEIAWGMIKMAEIGCMKTANSSLPDN